VLVACVAVAALAAVLPARAAATFHALTPLPSLGSGRVWSVSVSPAQAGTILAGTDSGVYTSRDSGATWRLTLPAVRAWTVGFDARNASAAFAGTAGRGVFYSPDGGGTWTASSTGLNNLDVRTLAFGLGGLAAGTGSGVYMSGDGHTWHDVGLDGDSVSALAVAANSPQLTVIAGIDSGKLGAGYLYRGNGASWTPLQSGLPANAAATALAAGPIDEAVPQRPLVAVTTKGMYRSGDSGNTWTSSTGVPQSVTPTTATFDPLDPAVVYAGADQGGSTGGALLRSTDSGLTFGSFNTGVPNNALNVEHIAAAPTTPLTLVLAVDPPKGGGVVYVGTDSSLGAPPQLVAEAPGAPVPAVVSTPTPRATAKPAPRSQPAHQEASGFGAFAAAAFHWPTPLVYEILFVLIVIYGIVRWRQRYYVEGPP
jgi:hypothetical protein